MEAVLNAPGRAVSRQWLLGGAVATLFVGIQGVWQFLSLLVFFVQPASGFGERVNFFWDIFVSAWGVYVAYAVVVAVSVGLVRRLCAEAPLQDLWAIIWRSAVMFVPACLVVTFFIAMGTALVQDRPMFFLGFELFG